nr:hypothetical protein CFP56_25282 [Quercus suber]
MHCQPEEGLNPQKSGGFPNPFPSRAEGGSREVEGECVGRVGSERAIGRAVLGCEVFEVGVKRLDQEVDRCLLRLELGWYLLLNKWAWREFGFARRSQRNGFQNMGGNGEEVTGSGEGYGGGYNFYGVELCEVGVNHGFDIRGVIERKSVRCPVHLVVHHELDSEFEALNPVANDGFGFGEHGGVPFLCASKNGSGNFGSIGEGGFLLGEVSRKREWPIDSGCEIEQVLGSGRGKG